MSGRKRLRAIWREPRSARPLVGDPLRKLVTLDAETIRRLDNYRFGQRISRESDAIRRLIEIGLDHVEANQNHQPPQAEKAV